MGNLAKPSDTKKPEITANSQWSRGIQKELEEILHNYNHAVYMEHWTQASAWWRALELFYDTKGTNAVKPQTKTKRDTIKLANREKKG